MPERRLEDRIRRLCAELLNADSGSGQAVGEELREAIHQHFEHLRKMISASKGNRRATASARTSLSHFMPEVDVPIHGQKKRQRLTAD